MSGLGDCPRVLCAHRLGHEPMPSSKADLERLLHYTRCEELAAKQIEDYFGYPPIDAGECQLCKQRTGISKMGHHVEIQTPLFNLVGHLDRKIDIKGTLYPIEIKSLGNNTFNDFQKSQFSNFINYEYQEVCYLEAEQKPGLYWIMNRDNGTNQKYIVNDYDKILNLPGFTRVFLKTTFDDIVCKLNDIEVDVADGVLTEAEQGHNCWFCKYKYLCQKDAKKTIAVSEREILDAGEMYLEAMKREEAASELKERARAILLEHAIKNNLENFSFPGANCFYKGMKSKKTYNIDILKKNVSKEILRLAEKEGTPYPDFLIRRTKEN